MAQFTLSKQERLSSLKEIETLFTQGKSLVNYPLRLVWRESLNPGQVLVQVMFSVSKKRFPKAVDRNRIKRLMRESYRLLKPEFYLALPPEKSFHLGLVYTGNEIEDFQAIQKSLAKALERLIIQIRPAVK